MGECPNSEDVGVVRVLKARGNEQVEGASHDFIGLVPENPTGSLVEEGDEVLRVDADDGVGGQRDDARQQFIG